MEYLYLLLPVSLLVLTIFSAYSLTRKAYRALEKYGRPWATLGGIATFIISFCAFGFATLSVLLLNFGR